MDEIVDFKLAPDISVKGSRDAGAVWFNLQVYFGSRGSAPLAWNPCRFARGSDFNALEKRDPELLERIGHMMNILYG